MKILAMASILGKYPLIPRTYAEKEEKDMETRKFELTKETKVIGTHILHQIRALVDIRHDVKACEETMDDMFTFIKLYLHYLP